MAFPHQTPNDPKQLHAIANSYGLRLDGTTKLQLSTCH